ncbi:GGDEF domain-containing protein [Aggregicoccus sp. 17bor-14]|uniref:GGDEF domain-containing protein n=1 Tax=Myxococcaceae TaxID=31 RepID=UPI00129C32A5|nr:MULTISPECIES: GGDEF domain-containing protein [Myxococcaceae]MBF5043831.1 GGDEF domain-containing protein [Simulacricoccus sp. 17bor-14]MRI89583.1 GGDEF domain-containing protein [Aggregicoccus sp. 17bor-14]
MAAEQTRVTSMAPRPGAGNEGAAPGGWLVQIHGPQLGRKVALGGGALGGGAPGDGAPGAQAVGIGRDPDNAVAVELDTVSRHHARLWCEGADVWVEDLGSTNGTWLNHAPLPGPARLESGDLLKVGGALFKFLSGGDVEVQYHETLYQLAISDGLTGASNKRFLLEYLERELGRCHRYGRALSLLLFDLDHFKRINDMHGHVAGDQVLRELAQGVLPLVRREQCFARYGGEEFALVLPEDGPDKARHFAEKLRRQVAERAFRFEGVRIPVTVSIGVADLTAQMTEPQQLLQAADAQLYEAKRGGRNRVAG